MAPCGSSAAAIVSFGRRVSTGEGGEEGLKWGRMSNGLLNEDRGVMLFLGALRGD